MEMSDNSKNSIDSTRDNNRNSSAISIKRNIANSVLHSKKSSNSKNSRTNDRSKNSNFRSKSNNIRWEYPKPSSLKPKA